MKIKRIIAREWLIFLVCIFIGIVSYILDDYLSWKKVQSTSYNFTGIPKEELDKIEQARRAGYSDEEIYKFLKSKAEKEKEKKTFLDFEPITPEKYKLGEGYSEKGYLLFILYFLSLFIRSIVWSITQLRRKL